MTIATAERESSTGLYPYEAAEIDSHWGRATEDMAQLLDLGYRDQLQLAGERAKIYVARGVSDSRIQAVAMYSGYAACGLVTQLHLRVRSDTDRPFDRETRPEEMAVKLDAANTVYIAMRKWLQLYSVPAVTFLTAGIHEGQGPKKTFQLGAPLRPHIPLLDSDLAHNYFTYPVDGEETPDQIGNARLVSSILKRVA